MGGPARLLALLAVAAATHAQGAVAAASDRFVPADPAFVVANIRQALPDEACADCSPPGAPARAPTPPRGARRRFHRACPQRCASLAISVAPRPARAARRRPGASAACAACTRRSCNIATPSPPPKHCSMRMLREAPRDPMRALLRASMRLVRGDFAGARADCAQLAQCDAMRASASPAWPKRSPAAANSRAAALLDSMPTANTPTGAVACLSARHARRAARAQARPRRRHRRLPRGAEARAA